ncbi:glycoside hydrolase family 32 protein [Companilactobacillus hulinensis]|uniref:glycoside hydrolase family 32 protein n=1 Tax=Companilactobacillus hulinensis TaxID=2486007 RepID=UPI000F7982A0|nr:glycoside hydrolase family 32 protein [Companilactobacillus hulinensis]
MQTILKPIKVTNSRYRLGYHVASKAGWINDPNGFVFFKGYYHVFYQHYPYASEWGPMHWGHSRSKDLVHWETLPIALTPGDKEDEDGCFSGSAVVHDGKMYLIYTGHHYYENDDNHDHFWQNQNLAISEDGIHFKKYKNNPIISAAPEDNTQHFRDPKVWYDNGNWYLILGSQANDNLGRVLLYKSSNLIDWDYQGPITKSVDNKKEGYMWECPDFFRLGDKQVLLMSPQGIEADGIRFNNENETGYLTGNFNYAENTFNRSNFQELDSGHDFYATQTTLAPDGRRLVTGWMESWGNPMPEQADGWAGALVFPRELTLKNDKLYMNPVSELKNLRTEELSEGTVKLNGKKSLNFISKQYEALVNFDIKNATEAGFSLTDSKNTKLLHFSYSSINDHVSVERTGEDGVRETIILPTNKLKLHILVDTSSVEIFVNDGEATFTERIYSEDALKFNLLSNDETHVSYNIYQLDSHAIEY